MSSEENPWLAREQAVIDILRGKNALDEELRRYRESTATLAERELSEFSFELTYSESLWGKMLEKVGYVSLSESDLAELDKQLVN